MAIDDRWPFFEDRLFNAEELFRAFAPFMQRAGGQRTSGVFPPVNLYDDGQSFLLRVEVPGIDKDALEVTAQGDQVTLRGERALNGKEQGELSYHRRERGAGQFRRTFTLPQRVDAERIRANYVNGVLEVVLPRVAELQPRKIAIG